MTQRPRLALLAALLFACGEVSQLGKGRDDQNSSGGGTGGQSGGHGSGARGGLGNGDNAGTSGGGAEGAGQGNDAGTGGDHRPTGLCVREGTVCFENQLYNCPGADKDPSFIRSCEIGCADVSSCADGPLCAPKAEKCVDTQVSRCNSSGTDWLPPTDCPPGTLCSNDSCKSTACEPGRWYCRDGDVYRCNAKGTFGDVYEDCNPAYQRCFKKDDGSAFCGLACEPGTQVCVSLYEAFGTCRADGSLPAVDQATFCAFNELCQAGKCVRQECLAYCDGGQIHSCLNDRLTECGPGQTCQDVIPSSFNYSVVCAEPLCSPGATACIGNQVGPCAPDGKSLSQVTTDCKANGGVCTVDAQCARTVTDTLGTPEGLEIPAQDALVANVISVHSPRKLTEMQWWLMSLRPLELRFVVYELVGRNFVERADAFASSVVVNGAYVSSGVGSFDYQLQAGGTYLFGLVVSGGEATHTHDFEPYAANLSFAAVRGRVVNIAVLPSIDVYDFETQETYVQTQYVDAMKVVTESP